MEQSNSSPSNKFQIYSYNLGCDFETDDLEALISKVKEIMNTNSYVNINLFKVGISPKEDNVTETNKE